MRDPLALLAVLATTLALLFQMLAAHYQPLPYNPTSILLPPVSSRNRDRAYILGNTADTPTSFVSLNISATISPDHLLLDTISPDPPFQSNGSHAILPSISPAGDISVYTGSCSASPSAALWRFTPDPTSSVGNGTWEQQVTDPGSDATAAALPGAYLLAAAFSFSTLVSTNASQTKIYVFGGMCPADAATVPTWQSAASYSNQMLLLDPTVSPAAPTTYTLRLPTNRGPPIAEAGFTMTALLPTTSSGSGIATQQQSFVLVGGHTQTAFINMSQVAIWGLPEESWSFVTVESPSTSNANTELAIKSTEPAVDSRSGHSAVLTEDGTKMVIFGGWVGDVSQAAEPQLAVLSLGQGYGGSGDWQWMVPDQQPSGSGIYGHGAVMLPGNVMMVLGGYNISTSGNSKRQTSSSARVQFFNATSMTWASNYTNPAYLTAMASDPANGSSSSDSNSNALRIGLGAGLGLGLAAIIGALVVCFCYSRRHERKAKEEREKNLRDLSLGASNVFESPRSQNGVFAWTASRWNGRPDNGSAGDALYDSNSAAAGYENLPRGVHAMGDGSQAPPAPFHIHRKPVRSRARGVYQPTPHFDFGTGNNHGRTNSLGTSGPIHPIYEADEDETRSHHGVEGVGIAISDPNFVPGPAVPDRFSDPFRDPPPANFSTPMRRGRSLSSSDVETPAQPRQREVQEWFSDWAAADALLNSQARIHSNVGRVSPARRAQLIAATTVSSVCGEEDNRTASNLSEGTERSVQISTVSISRSGSSSQGRSRSDSLRGFITGMNPFALNVATSTTHVGPGTLPQSSGSGSTNSFNTAQTSFPTLQAEGEALLPRPGGEGLLSGESSPTRHQKEYLLSGSGSPSKSKPSAFLLGKGRAGWFGSLRRVFTPVDAVERNPHAPIYRDHSPTRVDLSPRRTVSASAALWRRKQGKGDWEDSADINPRSNTFTSSSGIGEEKPQFLRQYTDREEDDEDWDVERAAENRVVQVMFTVPKERLRVVNCSEGDLDEGGSSVGGSVRSRKSLRKRASMRALLGNLSSAKPERDGGEGEGEGEGDALLFDCEAEEQKEKEEEREEEEEKEDEEEEATKSLGLDKGKGKEKDMEVEKEKLLPAAAAAAAARDESPETPSRKLKGKVLDIVEQIERHSSPERSPDRSPQRGV
ncbi:uncharacterized protein L3040_006262 [Drepanopeziza brunnea f. sp. 'multigermtubi']|uniref:Galactose oxidase n=1 Tax=Marssonina brunnea f. sp. multigermtubi (strain MB_m1) TaxID=1072389 RepID=K1WWB1_MARBU|nr:uncharacterized protein MBM_05231 [Drepanopeziza brunnea f. sp. 'multigermtubi' MB_m1]EKD16762.1 hypothetical protein MBM_05231 [Drepanopeziza brunnea f. sp. 'multigermtubi' MB_m1]KAJ5040613.1 hypothetical protein L3040_006262 [Drepanopeziza brunnea f. sp. 'multigermtubi']